MNPGCTDLKWHVLQVKPRSEKKVGRRLQDLGIAAYVPTQMQLRSWSDRKKLVEVVLFSNYVFVATDHQHRNDVFRVANVFKYLSFGGRIATLTKDEVALIKRLSGMETPISVTYEGFRVGEEVEILSGSLMGYRGKVTSTNGNSCLQLALPNLHCFANVEIRGEEVRKISKVPFGMTSSSPMP